MTALAPTVPAVVAAAPTTIVPTAADTIPCSQFNVVFLVIRTGATNTYLGTIDDPTSQNPAGTLTQAGNFDVTTGTVPISSTRVMRLDCGRFRDINGNINIVSSSTFAGTTLEAYGI